mgnify:CR=1 FL=1
MDENTTSEYFSVVQKEGNRDVSRNTKCYSLDAIITLGNKERADCFYALEDAECSSRRNYSGRIVKAPEVKPKKIYPNDPCPCGSGKKYKKCCGRKA